MRAPAAILLLPFLTACDVSAPPPDTPKAPPAAVFRAPGALRGRVRFDGPRPSPKPVEISDGDCFAHHVREPILDESLVVSEKGGLGGVIVAVTGGLPASARQDAPQAPARLSQRRCLFRPRVLTMTRGQALDVLNEDDTSHNVRCNPRLNAPFSFHQAPGAPAGEVPPLLAAESPLKITCELHPWMCAWIAVFSHPYHAVTDADGAFEIAGVPPGEVEVTFWHETLGERKVRVAVLEGKTSELEELWRP
jgi:hypothetical protein